MKKNEKGFSAIEGLLIVVIVGIIGFVGWYVWQAKSKNNKAATDTSQVETQTSKEETTTQQITEQNQIPEGWVEYKNESIGFAFAYPKEWGKASTEDAYDKRKNIGFVTDSGQGGEYVIRLHNKNAAHSDTSSPTLNIVGFSVSNGVLTIQKAGGSTHNVEASDILLNDNNGVVYTTKGNAEEGSNIIIGLKSVALKDYQVAIFDYLSSVDSSSQPKVLDTLKQEMASFKVL